MFKKHLNLLPLLSSLIVLLVFSSCYYDKEEELYPDAIAAGCDTSNVRYSVEIKAIFDSRCVSCHSGVNPSGNIRLDSYQEVKTYIDATNTKLVSSIVQDGNASAMPQGQPKLSDCDIGKIKIWVNAGYPEN
jgi:mono/diheme cytochrome c family protein